jgi:hypothetical protein
MLVAAAIGKRRFHFLRSRDKGRYTVDVNGNGMAKAQSM